MLPQQSGLVSQLAPGLVTQAPEAPSTSDAAASPEALPEAAAESTLALVAPQGPSPQADAQALALASAPLALGTVAFTELQVEVEGFIATNKIDERAAGNFRGQPPFVLRAVMDLGPLTSSSNPSASLMGRIKKAKEHIENVKREVAAKVEAFLAEEDGCDERASAQLRMQDPDVQLVVMDRGTLKTSTNPSASLMGRIKKALEPGGNLSRADIYSMKPGVARPVAAIAAPAAQPTVQSPQVNQMRVGSATMMGPTVSTPAQNAMLPMMMAPATLQGYSSALMGQYGAMAGGVMGGLGGVLGAAPTGMAAYQPAVGYQSLANFGYPGAMGQANVANAAMAAVPGLGQSLQMQQAAVYGVASNPQVARPAPY